ncbi:formylglycine-generating enzyme family protein [Candidatus Sumerlaeota bacterium]|nr:formylglycine-generating enzyme family protein [Candidatus Sumerlaeota bacterium]
MRALLRGGILMGITLAALILWTGCGPEVAPPEAPTQVSEPPPPPPPSAPQEIANTLGMRLRLIPAGSFTMGSPPEEPSRDEDEGPQRTVTFAGPFCMGLHEVTVDQYRPFIEATGRDEPRQWSDQLQNPNRPVVLVSWEDATAFCEWLTQSEDAGTYSLPSEAQWEYACRAGTTGAHITGNTLDPSQANFHTSAPVDVGSYPPNAWGLFDMQGNAWEWCQDWYHATYEGAPTDGSAWVDTPGGIRVLRGGSWHEIQQNTRVANRSYADPRRLLSDYGFRVVRTVE